MDKKQLLIISNVVALIPVLFLTVSDNPFATATKQTFQEELEQCNPDNELDCGEQPSNETSIFKEKSGSDQTRPSDSIKAEEPDSVQVDLGGNQTAGVKPDLPPLNDQMSKYKIKVTFHSMKVVTRYESDVSWSDRWRNGGEFFIYAYVQGKRLLLYDNLTSTRAHVIEPNSYSINKEITVYIPPEMPLSIMTVGYERDECPLFKFPEDIQEKVIKNFQSYSGFNSLNPFAKYPHLRGIQENLNNQINSECVQDDDRHETLGHINKVFQPTSYGAGIHDDDAGGERNYPDFKLTYRIEVTPPINTISK